MDDDDPLAHHAHLRQDVAGQEDGPVLAEILDQRPRMRDLDRIDADRRLIQNQHLRIVHDRLGEPHPLPVALRELRQDHVAILLQGADLDHLVDPPGGRPLVEPPQPARESQVRMGGHVVVERDDLREVADVAAALQRIARHVVLGDEHVTARGHQVAGHHLHGGGLAGAVGSQEADDLALLDVEGDVVDGQPLPVVLGEILYAYHLGCRPARPMYPWLPPAAKPRASIVERLGATLTPGGRADRGRGAPSPRTRYGRPYTPCGCRPAVRSS